MAVNNLFKSGIYTSYLMIFCDLMNIYNEVNAV